MNWLLPLLAFALAYGLCLYLSRPGRLGAVLDQPNHRSMHDRPIPRGGGLAFVPLILAAGLAYWLSGRAPGLWLAGLALLAAVSWRDDIEHVPAGLRLLAQAGASVLLLWDFGGGLAPALPMLPAALAWGFGLLACLWLINLYNFMDGMDGFAGGMAVLGFASLGLAGAWLGAPDYARFWLWAAAAVAGFLVLNFPPARLFMGDVGSASLGFCVATGALWGLELGLDWRLPLLIFSPFWVDASLTLVKRIWRRERVWEAHAQHYYQRLVRAGWSKRRVVLSEYALMLAMASLGFAGLARPADWDGILGMAALIHLALLGLCHGRWLAGPRVL
ncbi:MAG: glycosyltransferase family 4 protein [Gammaproteobacteria bacterium]|nr:glycosyltransferase family 4 protein [Gammaproteobacteria bacterium]